MNINDMIRRAANATARDPEATMEMHLPWQAKGLDVTHMFKDGTGPMGIVVASGNMGMIARFKAKDVLTACHGIKCGGGTLQQAG